MKIHSNSICAIALALLASCAGVQTELATQPLEYQLLSPVELRVQGLSGFQSALGQRLPVGRAEGLAMTPPEPAPTIARLSALQNGFHLATIRIVDRLYENLELVVIYRFDKDEGEFELYGCGAYSSTDVAGVGGWLHAYRPTVQLQIRTAQDPIHGLFGGSFLRGSKVIQVDPLVEFLIPKPTAGAKVDAAALLSKAVWSAD